MIERQNGQYVCQRSLLVRQREHHAALVGLGKRTHHIGLVRIAHYQESGKVMLVVLDMILKHLQSVQLGSLGMTDGSPSALLALGNHLGTTGSILGLHILKLWVLSQEVAALHQGYGVRVYLGNGVPIVLRQTADAVGDVQLMLAYDGSTAITQQLVVVQQTTRNRILDSQHAYGGRILLHLLKHLFEG